MKNMLQPVLVIAMTVAAVACATPVAAIEVTATVERGGGQLDFGSYDPAEGAGPLELRLGISQTGAAQYRLVQEYVNPLREAQGRALPEDVLQVVVVQPSTGTVRNAAREPARSGLREIFTSDAAGTAETVTLIYDLAATSSASAGTYDGLLRFRVEAADGATATQQVVIRVQVRPDQAAGVSLGRAGGLRFGRATPDAGTLTAQMPFVLRGPLEDRLRVRQHLIEPLSNAMGQRLEGGTLQIQGPTGPALELTESPTLLEPWIVTANPVTVETQYALTLPAGARAGAYHGLLLLEWTSERTGGSGSFTAPVEVDIPQLFALQISAVDGGQGLAFGTILPGASSELKSLTVTLQGNMDGSYQLLQQLVQPLTDDLGNVLPAEALQCVSVEGQGGSLLGAPAALAVEPQAIYRSQSLSTTEQARVTYRLTIPPEARAGTYRTVLQFTAVSQ